MTYSHRPSRVGTFVVVLTGCAALAIVLGGAVAALAFAAPSPATGAGKPAVQPIVSIKKADGSTLRGQLVDSDGRHITVKPAEGKTFGEPVELPWSDVKAVSGGLTQAKAQEAWKLAHKDELCETCHGERFPPCSTCKGTGHDPASRSDCKTCKGELTVDCSDKRCDQGMIPCPGQCLKITEGSWTKTPDKDGKRWRSFRVKGGTHKISDAHLGEVVKVENGELKFGTPCEICGKTGKVACPTCQGHGTLPCPTCKADKTAADCAACDDGTQACATCGGSGLKGAGAAAAPSATPTPAAPPAPAAGAAQPVEKTPAGNTGDGLD
jgi:hypothetical protein